jgi:hypothetical protein
VRAVEVAGTDFAPFTSWVDTGRTNGQIHY